MKKIFFDGHSLFRLGQRSSEFGIDIYDAKRRSYETVLCGNFSRTKKSRKRIIFYKYFNDNISFFVFCIKNRRRGSYEIKSVIIQEGRE